MNASERKLAKLLADNGYKVLRNGWPDFMVISDDGHNMAVELKTETSEKLNPEQVAMHAALEKAGVPVLVAVKNGSGYTYRISGEAVQTGGFEIVPRDTQTL